MSDSDNETTKRRRGRPHGTTYYGEPTTTMRVPATAISELEAYLRARAEKRIQTVPPNRRDGVELFQTSERGDGVKRPLFSSTVAAGFPSPADDYIEEWLDLNSLLVSDKPATFFVRVKGDSMIDEGIRPGDLLVVDKGMQAQSGDIVIAVVDNELTVKELEIIRGRIRLLPANKMLEPIELKDGQQLLVWGVVTATVHQFTRARKARPAVR